MSNSASDLESVGIESLSAFATQFSVLEDLLDLAKQESKSAPTAPRDISNARILVVDDEPVNVKVACKYLKDGNFLNRVSTSDSTQAMNLIREHRPDLVLLDLMMPQVDGFQILRELRQDSRVASTPVIILTATDDRAMKRDALDLGVVDFLQKPVDPYELLPRVKNVLTIKSYQDHLKDYAANLEHLVAERTRELEESRLEVIYCLGRAAEYRDNETGKHVIRVGQYVAIIARALGLTENVVDLLAHAAPLHDMGKIGIPDSVLLKPGKLTSDEFEIMRRHTEYGCDIVSSIHREEDRVLPIHSAYGANPLPRSCSPILRTAAVIALTHHERWDGTGYPLGLRGEQIPLEGRITAVADVFDALTSRRPYKEAFTPDVSFKIMKDSRGTHFDPRVLDAFFSQKDEILQVREKLADE